MTELPDKFKTVQGHLPEVRTFLENRGYYFADGSLLTEEFFGVYELIIEGMQVRVDADEFNNLAYPLVEFELVVSDVKVDYSAVKEKEARVAKEIEEIKEEMAALNQRMAELEQL